MKSLSEVIPAYPRKVGSSIFNSSGSNNSHHPINPVINSLSSSLSFIRLYITTASSPVHSSSSDVQLPPQQASHSHRLTFIPKKKLRHLLDNISPLYEQDALALLGIVENEIVFDSKSQDDFETRGEIRKKKRIENIFASQKIAKWIYDAVFLLSPKSGGLDANSKTCQKFLSLNSTAMSVENLRRVGVFARHYELLFHPINNASSKIVKLLENHTNNIGYAANLGKRKKFLSSAAGEKNEKFLSSASGEKNENIAFPVISLSSKSWLSRVRAAGLTNLKKNSMSQNVFLQNATGDLNLVSSFVYWLKQDSNILLDVDIDKSRHRKVEKEKQKCSEERFFLSSVRLALVALRKAPITKAPVADSRRSVPILNVYLASVVDIIDVYLRLKELQCLTTFKGDFEEDEHKNVENLFATTEKELLDFCVQDLRHVCESFHFGQFSNDGFPSTTDPIVAATPFTYCGGELKNISLDDSFSLYWTSNLIAQKLIIVLNNYPESQKHNEDCSVDLKVDLQTVCRKFRLICNKLSENNQFLKNPSGLNGQQSTFFYGLTGHAAVDFLSETCNALFTLSALFKDAATTSSDKNILSEEDTKNIEKEDYYIGGRRRFGRLRYEKPNICNLLIQISRLGQVSVNSIDQMTETQRVFFNIMFSNVRVQTSLLLAQKSQKSQKSLEQNKNTVEEIFKRREINFEGRESEEFCRFLRGRVSFFDRVGEILEVKKKRAHISWHKNKGFHGVSY